MLGKRLWPFSLPTLAKTRVRWATKVALTYDGKRIASLNSSNQVLTTRLHSGLAKALTTKRSKCDQRNCRYFKITSNDNTCRDE
jgi:hypothetical protein